MERENEEKKFKGLTGFILNNPKGTSLRDFQAKAVMEMLRLIDKSKSKGVYNACEQGLGKTVQAAVFANCLDIRTTLILCPTSVVLNWVNELKIWRTAKQEFYPLLKSSQIKKFSEWFSSVGPYKTVILSYDMAKKALVKEALCKVHWDLLIMDEAHKLKGRKTQRTQAALNDFWPRSTYKLALSGTPITDSVIDAYPIFSHMLPEFLGDFYEFANTFSNAEITPWGDKWYGIKNADTLKKLIRKHFFIRYTKDEVMPELPPKVFTKILLPSEYLYKVPETEIEVMKESVKAAVKAIEGGSTPPIPTSIAGIRKEQAIKKLPAQIDFIENILEQGLPLVVFTYHKDVLGAIVKHFYEYEPATISGESTARARELSISRFQDGGTNLFVGQIIAAGVGITLTRASHIVFAELSWSPTDISQACDRCHRIGQTGESVNIYYFSVEGSIEERIIDVCVDKAKMIDKLVN